MQNNCRLCKKHKNSNKSNKLSKSMNNWRTKIRRRSDIFQLYNNLNHKNSCQNYMYLFIFFDAIKIYFYKNTDIKNSLEEAK